VQFCDKEKAQKTVLFMLSRSSHIKEMNTGQHVTRQ